MATTETKQLQSTALIYLSIEPLNEIETKSSQKNVQNSGNKKLYQIQRILEDFYNYACSYCSTTNTIKYNQVNEEKSWIPVDCLTQWFNRITNKLSNDPNYLPSN